MRIYSVILMMVASCFFIGCSSDDTTDTPTTDVVEVEATDTTETTETSDTSADVESSTEVTEDEWADAGLDDFSDTDSE